MGSQKRKEKQRRWGRTRGVCRSSGERMKNKPRGVGDKTAHWPRVRLTTLLVARPFLLASGQPGHFCLEHQRRERDCGQQSRSYIYMKKRKRTGLVEKRREISKRFLAADPGNWIVPAKLKEEIRRVSSRRFTALRHRIFARPSHHAPHRRRCRLCSIRSSTLGLKNRLRSDK